MLLSNTFDTARPVRRRFISSWLECPNCDVMVVFGSSMSVIKMHQERGGQGGAGPRGGGGDVRLVMAGQNRIMTRQRKGNLTITYSVDASRCHQRHHEVHDTARSLKAFERRWRPRRRRCSRGGGGGTIVGADTRCRIGIHQCRCLRSPPKVKSVLVPPPSSPSISR